MTRPNFLFVSTHDINPHLGCYADVWPDANEAVTPHLDDLAAAGVRFDNALAAAPVCAPARSAIFTGAYPTAAGTMHMRANAVPPAAVQLVPEILRRAGYFATNNWFTDFQFDVPLTAFDYNSEQAHWRDRPTSDTPFFAAFHSLITHESKLYADEDTLAHALATVPPESRHDSATVTLPPYYPDTEEFRSAWTNYLDLITAMDDWVGELLNELDDDGLADNTVVIFWSDHGIGMPGGKRWASEAGLRVPLIVRWPAALAGGQVRTDVVETLDLAATVLSLAGLPIPDYMDSTPLLSAEGDQLPTDGLAFSARDRMMDDEDTSRTVRDARFRYVRHLHPDRSALQYGQYPDQFPPTHKLRMLKYEEARQMAAGLLPTVLTEPQRRLVATAKEPEELYDLVNDPHQTCNLIDDPAFAEDRARLSEELDQWMTRTGDLGLIPELELLERWSPGGERPRVASPLVSLKNGAIHVAVDDPGVTTGWTREEPHIDVTPSAEARLGRKAQSDKPWQIYAAPIPRGTGPVWLRSWRLGHEPSETVRIG